MKALKMLKTHQATYRFRQRLGDAVKPLIDILSRGVGMCVRRFVPFYDAS